MQFKLECLSSSRNEPVFSHPNVWAWNSEKWRASPGVGRVCQQQEHNISVLSSHKPFPHPLPLPNEGQTAQQVLQSSSAPLPFAFVPWWCGGAVAGRFSFDKNTQVEEIGTCASEHHFFFPSGHCSFALAGKAGQDREWKEICPCCVVCCHLQAVGRAALCWYWSAFAKSNYSLSCLD